VTSEFGLIMAWFMTQLPFNSPGRIECLTLICKIYFLRKWFFFLVTLHWRFAQPGLGSAGKFNFLKYFFRRDMLFTFCAWGLPFGWLFISIFLPGQVGASHTRTLAQRAHTLAHSQQFVGSLRFPAFLAAFYLRYFLG